MHNSGTLTPEKAVSSLDPAGTKEEHIHVFVDNSNIAEPYRSQHEKDMGKPAQKIFPQKLAKVVEGGRLVDDRWVVGSGSNSPLQHQWKSAGYSVKWDPRYGSEHNVDEALQAQIWKALSKRFDTATSVHTLVLLTGDGNQNGGASSFPDCIEAAMTNGWRVEVWCWRRKSSKVYERFARDSSRTGFGDGSSSGGVSRATRGLKAGTACGSGGRVGSGKGAVSTVGSLSGDTENTLCVVCWDNPRTVLLMPCKHLQLCEICAVGCTQCPSCRAKVTDIMNIYT
eukprot:gene7243-14699_t